MAAYILCLVYVTIAEAMAERLSHSVVWIMIIVVPCLSAMEHCSECKGVCANCNAEILLWKICQIFLQCRIALRMPQSAH